MTSPYLATEPRTLAEALADRRKAAKRVALMWIDLAARDLANDAFGDAEKCIRFASLRLAELRKLDAEGER